MFIGEVDMHGRGREAEGKKRVGGGGGGGGVSCIISTARETSLVSAVL